MIKGRTLRWIRSGGEVYEITEVVREEFPKYGILKHFHHGGNNPTWIDNQEWYSVSEEVRQRLLNIHRNLKSNGFEKIIEEPVQLELFKDNY